MKICFVIPHFSPSSSTHYGYTIKLADQVARQYTSVLFLESGQPPQKHNFTHVYVQHLIKPFNLIHRFYVFLKLRLTGTRVFYIHYSFYSLLIIRLINFFLPCRILYWHSEKLTPQDLSSMPALEKVQLTLSIKLAPILVTGGQNLKTTYHQTFNKPLSQIKIISPYVNPPKPLKESQLKLRSQLNLPQNKTLVLFVHRLSPRKGGRLLPEIIESAVTKNSQLHFVIVGNGPLKKYLTAKLQNLPAILVGAVAQANIYKYFQSADIFFMPSLREGSPRVILEAMSYGLPIVASRVGETSTFLPTSQHQFIASPNTPSLVKKLIELSSNTRVQQQLSKVNTTASQSYNLTTAVQDFLKLIPSSQ